MMRTLLWEGKTKQIFATENPSTALVNFKDTATAFNAEKKEQIAGKGELNNSISTHLFGRLTEAGIPNHFIQKVSSTEQLVKKLKMIPLEVVVRNVAAGSLVKRLGFREGDVFATPITEFYLKNDDLGDPLVNEDHIILLQLTSRELLRKIKELSLEINALLKGVFSDKNIQLVDFKLEFGLDSDSGLLMLGDEISPDTCRFWDSHTGEKLDKDRFRFNLGNVMEGYAEILARLGDGMHV